MIQVFAELVERLFEINVVFPEGIVGVEDQVLSLGYRHAVSVWKAVSARGGRESPPAHRLRSARRCASPGRTPILTAPPARFDSGGYRSRESVRRPKRGPPDRPRIPG